MALFGNPWGRARLDLHSYAFDCVTHHLFHPYGSNSLLNKQDEHVMREVAFDDSLQSKSEPLHTHIHTYTYTCAYTCTPYTHAQKSCWTQNLSGL
jgi:hypothetical protein